MRNQLRSLAARLTSNYWFLPLVMGISAFLLADLTEAIDRALSDSDRLSVVTYSVDSARTLLSTIAGSTITTAGIVYSLTMVALTLGSQQYGPLVVYNLLRDRSNQLTMGVFIATFLYCLNVLSAVDVEGIGLYVPALSVFVAVLFAVASMFVLIYFINHLAKSIRANDVIDRVAAYLDDPAVFFPSAIGSDPAQADSAPPETFAQAAEIMRATETGYVQFVDEQDLFEAAQRHDLLIELRVRPGMYVLAGGVVGRVLFPATASADVHTAIQTIVNDALFIGEFRTQEQDIELVFNQLVTIAIRALSPGINDPYTATMCLNRIGDALARVAQYTLPSRQRCDEAGTLRLILNPVRFDQLVHLAFDQIFHYGKADLTVVVHLLRILCLIGETLSGVQQAALLSYAQEIYARSTALHTSQHARTLIDAEYQAAAAALTD